MFEANFLLIVRQQTVIPSDLTKLPMDHLGPSNFSPDPVDGGRVISHFPHSQTKPSPFLFG